MRGPAVVLTKAQACQSRRPESCLPQRRNQSVTLLDIQEFCSATYGVTFPLFEKIDVNGPGRHPIYAELTAVPDADGKAGDIQWNFEKFLVSHDGQVLARFRPLTDPEAPQVIEAIEASLA